MYQIILLIIFNLLNEEVSCQNFLDDRKFNPEIQHRISKSPHHGNYDAYISDRRSLFDYLPKIFKNPVSALLSSRQDYAAKPEDVAEPLRAERRGDLVPNELSKEQIKNHIEQLKKFNTYKLHNIHIPAPRNNQESKEQRIYIVNPLESNFPASFTWTQYREIMNRRIQESRNKLHKQDVSSVILTSDRPIITEDESVTYKFDEQPRENSSNYYFSTNDDVTIAVTTERPMMSEKENLRYDVTPSRVISKTSHGIDDVVKFVTSERAISTGNEKVTFDDKSNMTLRIVKKAKMSEKATGSKVEAGTNVKKLLRSGDDWEMAENIQKKRKLPSDKKETDVESKPDNYHLSETADIAESEPVDPGNSKVGKESRSSSTGSGIIQKKDKESILLRTQKVNSQEIKVKSEHLKNSDISTNIRSRHEQSKTEFDNEGVKNEEKPEKLTQSGKNVSAENSTRVVNGYEGYTPKHSEEDTQLKSRVENVFPTKNIEGIVTENLKEESNVSQAKKEKSSEVEIKKSLSAENTKSMLGKKESAKEINLLGEPEKNEEDEKVGSENFTLKNNTKYPIITEEIINENQTFAIKENSESDENSSAENTKRENKEKLLEVTYPGIQGKEKVVAKNLEMRHEGETDADDEAVTTPTTELLPEAVTISTTKLPPLKRPLTFMATGGTREDNDFAYN